MTQSTKRSDPDLAGPPAGSDSGHPDRPEPLPGSAGSWWRQSYLWLVVLGGLVIFNLIYALPRYLSLDPAQSRSLLNPEYPIHFPLLVAHVVTGNIAMVTVLLQLWPWLRRRHPRVHHLSGRIYLYGGVLPSTLLGLLALIPLRPYAVGTVSLVLMGVLWIATTVVGYRRAVQHRYASHQRWMVYSFALSLGTSWGRVIVVTLGLFPTFQINFSVLVDVTSWLWVITLLIAHWWVESRATRTAGPQGGEVVSYPSPLVR